MWGIFSYAYLPSVYFLWWGASSDLLSVFLSWIFVFLLLNFKSSLCILDNSLLEDFFFFAKFFCRSVAFLFILNNVFHRAEVLNFNEVQLHSIFAFIDLCLWYESRIFHLFFLLLYPYLIKYFLAHSKDPINICWMTKCCYFGKLHAFLFDFFSREMFICYITLKKELYLKTHPSHPEDP